MMAVLQRLHEQQQADRGFEDDSSHNSSSTDSDSDGDSDLDEGAGRSAAYKQLKSMSPAVKQLLKRVSNMHAFICTQCPPSHMLSSHTALLLMLRCSDSGG
jgi:hypothetical protein